MKKIIIFSAAILLPILAGAATLNNTFITGTVFPSAGSTTSVSSTCGITGANNTVSFSLNQNGINTALSTNLTTDNNGGFSGNISFPSTAAAGTAILIATCNKTGDTINSPTLTFPAQTSTAFGLPAVIPTIGGIYNVLGACGNSNGVGSAQLTLSSSGSIYQLGSLNLSQTGTFSGNVIIPNNINTGQATLIALCSNANTFSSIINIGSAAVDSFVLSSNPFPGSNTVISGNCNNVISNANGTVNFSFIRNGFTTNLPASNSLTNGSGMFNTSVFFPTSLGTDPGTLVVTCPNNSTFSNVIMLGLVSPVVTPTPVIPVGGVAAGYGPKR